MRYLCLLLLIACTTPGPVYERGTPTARPVARVRPGVGAPIVGQHPAAITQHSPQPQRVLPPTREPGIWASTDPLATMSATTLLDVPLPDPDDPEAKKIRRFCARSMGFATKTGEFEPAVAQLSVPERRCLAARLYFRCVNELLADFEKTAEALALTVIEHVYVEAMRKTEPIALDFVRRECRSVTPAVEVLAHDIGRAWIKDVIQD